MGNEEGDNKRSINRDTELQKLLFSLLPDVSFYFFFPSPPPAPHSCDLTV